MKAKLLGMLLLAGSQAVAAPRVAVAIGIGGGPGFYSYPAYPYSFYAPAPRLVVASPAYISPAPNPGYTWVGGYWYPVGPRYYWRTGYWARPPYAGARWVGPRYYGSRYVRGYWRR